MRSLLLSTALVPLLVIAEPHRAFADCAPDSVGAGETVLCTGADTDGFADDSDGIRVEIAEGASVVTTGAAAIDVDDDVEIENRGLVEARGDGDEGVQAGDDLDLLNAATGTIRAADKGVQTGDGLSLANEGLIEAGDEGVEAGDFATVGNAPGATIRAVEDAVQVGRGGLVVNLGTIESTGDDGDGISIASGDVLNAGTITAASPDGAAIVVEAADPLPGDAAPVKLDLDIVNEGTIRGATGIQAGTGANVRSQRVTTSGLIEGTGGVAVNLGAGDDVLNVIEGGDVVGEVILGAGDDTLIFTDLVDGEGRLVDLFDGGDAMDTVVFASLNRSDVSVRSFIDLVLTLTVDLPALGDAEDFEFRFTNFETFVFVDVTESFPDLVPAIPLPAGLPLLAGGLGLLALARRRR